MNDTAMNGSAGSAGESTGKEAAIKLEANVRPIKPINNLVAFASVKIADCFVVDNIKVVAGEKGLMVDMPSVKGGDGKYHDVAFPVTADFRKQINEAIVDGYAAAVDKVRNIGEAQKEYTEKPRIADQLRAGQEKAAARDAARPQPEAAAKRTGPGLEG